jgi:hypothetical protein
MTARKTATTSQRKTWRSPLSRLDVEGYGRHVPRHALGDHGRGRLSKLFEMCRGAVCVQGGCVVVDLVEEHMVRLVVLKQTTRLL